MEIKNKHKLVKVKSVYDPTIVTFKRAITESGGRTRQFIELLPLTFGLIEEPETKVIINDDIYKAFIKKCKRIDSKK